MEERRPQAMPPQMQGGGGGRGDGGEGGILVILALVAILVYFLRQEGEKYVNNLIPDIAMLMPIIIITTALSWLMNKRVYATLVIEADKVLGIAVVFALFLRYSEWLPSWISGNLVMLMVIFQMITLFARVKLTKLKIDAPEIIFGTSGLILVMFLATNVPLFGQAVAFIRDLITM